MPKAPSSSRDPRFVPSLKIAKAQSWAMATSLKLPAFANSARTTSACAVKHVPFGAVKQFSGATAS